MKTSIFLFAGLLICSLSTLSAQQKYVDSSTKVGTHPRLLLQKGEEKKIKNEIKKDILWTQVNNEIIDEASVLLTVPVNERKLTGRRLLGVSRENLRRIFILSYAYRMTGDKKYLNRAEDEMMKIASYEDWHPDHFLDVGEMTMAMAIGYDWLYDKLSPANRAIIEASIIEKGIKPSYDEKVNWFITASHNWNQVCNAGESFGALAIWDKNPELASDVINRAVESIKLPMAHYAPDGAYPEGVGYWDYGTSFNALFLSAVEKIFHIDFNLSAAPGFLKTGEYVLQMVTPGLKNFAYSDNGGNAFMTPTMFWFYDKTKDASILYNQSRLFQKNGAKQIRNDRLAPAMIIWGASAPLSQPVIPTQLFWKANGDNPVCAMRSDWQDPSALFLGVKLGSPKVNHGHMDIGSFILESDGIMWATDLGGENYNQIETAGVALWGMKQDAQRWDVYRYNNYVHNTLIFNKKLQLVDGKADFLNSSDNKNNMYVVADLTPVYKNEINDAKRAYSLIDGNSVVIEDQIQNGGNFTMATWNMATLAKATVVSDNVMMLEKDGKKLYLKVETPESIRWFIKDAKSDYTYDSPNPGMSIIGFNTDIRPKQIRNIKVYLIPGEDRNVNYKSHF